jgi:uncharacterized Ntn-hydrolase superfamily protein
MHKNLITLVITLLLFKLSIAQNLPSLLLNKNVNSTFSITAYDEVAHEWGIAVATNNIYVGNSTIYIEPGVGAFSVIAETNPDYAINGFQQLKTGKTIAQAINYTREKDDEFDTRQVAGIDAKGNVYALTGSALKNWKGYSSHLLGKNFVVMGNQLGDSVLVKMAYTFGHTSGTLAERLLKSLLAGQVAGGQLSGKQSAALAVKGINNEWFNQIDLRVDNSKTPFDDLQKLLNYHYGRIEVNQTINALKAGNVKRGEALLHDAEIMVDGWNGMYGRIAEAYILLGDDKKAIAVIKKALAENNQWKENLSAFYCLAQYPEYRQLIDENTFTVKDWDNAIQLMLQIKHTKDAIDLTDKTLKKYPESSFTWCLLGEARQQQGDKIAARKSLETALKIDPDNAEAKRELGKLNM